MSLRWKAPCKQQPMMIYLERKPLPQVIFLLHLSPKVQGHLQKSNTGLGRSLKHICEVFRGVFHGTTATTTRYTLETDVYTHPDSVAARNGCAESDNCVHALLRGLWSVMSAVWWRIEHVCSPLVYPYWANMYTLLFVLIKVPYPTKLHTRAGEYLYW